MTETIPRALALYDTVVAERTKGNEFVLHCQNGRELKLLLVLG